MIVGNSLGRAVKIDSRTLLVERGKFARICVEMNLKKPLTPFIWINHDLQPVEYEGLYQICFQCRQYGHIAEHCGRQGNEREAARKDLRQDGGRKDRKALSANHLGHGWLWSPGELEWEDGVPTGIKQ